MRDPLGRHYITQKKYAERFVEALNPSEKTIEVGGGRGAITTILIDKGISPVVIERDKRNAAFLLSRFKGKAEIVCTDILKYNLKQYRSVSIIANLPFSISKKFFLYLLLNSSIIKHAVVSFQKDFFLKLTAAPNSTNYSILSILYRLFVDGKKLFDIPKTAFYPEPSVLTTVISLKFKDNFNENFLNFLKKAFSRPHKKLYKNLFMLKQTTVYTEEILNKRAIEVKPYEYFSMFNSFFN